MRAIVFGGSGAVGISILTAIAERRDKFQNVTLVLRRKIDNLETLFFPSAPGDGSYFIQVIVDNFDSQDWMTAKQLQTDFDVAFYALGGKRREVDYDTYRKIELEYPRSIMAFLKRRNVQEVHYISSFGSSPTSFMSVLRYKYEAEGIISRAGIKCTFIYRVGGVLTPDKRGMHAFLQVLARFTDPWHSWSIPSEVLGKAIVNNCCSGADSREEIELRIIEHDQIIKLGSAN